MNITDGRLRWLPPVLLLLVVAALFYPALGSHFLLDDYINLTRLDEIDARGYLYYIFGGLAGPSGRPLSLLTFALQYTAWPDNPFAFKAVNLLIHLVNGLLVFTIVGTLFRRIYRDDRAAYWTAFITAALWLLHPIQLSTVLYVIQRMTELSALLTLAGLAGYLHYRGRYRDNGRPGELLRAGGVIATATLLGILAKENGVLLPLYIIVIEAVFFPDHKQEKAYRAWYGLCLLAPFILLGLYFGFTFDRILAGFDNRPFTLPQRLLSECVILFDYLRTLIIPQPDAFSLYHDDVRAVQGLFQPAYVAAAVAGIAALAVAGIRLRRRYPVPAFAALWFLAGHSLESSFLSLELYFEHRNYLPALGIFVLVAWLVVAGCRRIETRLVTGALGGAYLIAVLAVTGLVLHLWANPALQAIKWADVHPGSLRAQTNLADMYLVYGEFDRADTTYRRINDFNPDILFPYLKELLIKSCVREQEVSDAFWQKLYRVAEHAESDNHASLAALDDLVMNLNLGHCEKLNPVNLARVMLLLVQNPEYRDQGWALHEMIANISIYLGDARAALNNINRSIELRPYPNNLYLRVRILAALKNEEAARAALNGLKSNLAEHPRQALAYAGVVEDLEKTVSALGK